MCFLEKYDGLAELVAFALKVRFFTDQNGPKGDHMKMNFDIFKHKNECYKQLERKK